MTKAYGLPRTSGIAADFNQWPDVLVTMSNYEKEAKAIVNGHSLNLALANKDHVRFIELLTPAFKAWKGGQYVRSPALEQRALFARTYNPRAARTPA
jgi:hypothetical protein